MHEQQWQDRVLAASEPDTVIGGVIGLAHVVDSPEQAKLLAALDRLDFGKLSERQQLDALRAWSLAFIRLGAPDAKVAARLAAKLDPFYPAQGEPASRDFLNRELCEMLVFLKSPTVAAKTVAVLKQPSAGVAAPPPPPSSPAYAKSRGKTFGSDVLATLAASPDPSKISYVYSLRNLTEGWTAEDRIFYFSFLRDEHEPKGGPTYRMFLENVDEEAYDRANEADRLAVDRAGVRRPYRAVELPKPTGPGGVYTVDGLLALWSAHGKGRNFENGKRAFSAARCVVCHRFGDEGGSTGPDLTQLAGQYKVRDLAESLVEPSKVVSDQYRADRDRNYRRPPAGRPGDRVHQRLDHAANRSGSGQPVGEHRNGGYRETRTVAGFLNAGQSAVAAE